MNTFGSCLLAAAIGFSAPISAQPIATFLSHPSLSPDGKTLVFSYEGDLWKAATEGGQALRLTAMPGDEIAPRISPDGKWLAFSSNQFGNFDVYVMPLEGGDIRQLTFHDAADEVDSWSWDSQTIYFTSGRYNRFTSYTVNVHGGTAKRLFPHYFNTIHGVVEAPSGELLFNNTWESYSAANRKRYKGAYNPDILSYHPSTRAFKQYTDYEGKDFWATVDKQGNIYFASDEANGEYNLYTFINGQKTALTRFNTSIKRPSVAANGEKVAFERDYQLYIYDVAGKKTVQPAISLNRNLVLGKQQEFDAKDNISYFDVSPDGKKLAFISRGELFVSDIDGKFIRQMPSSGERAMEVKWLADNKTLLFNQTAEGYLNWFTIAADGKGAAKQLTTDLFNNRDVTFNNDRTKGVYLSGRDEVRILDLKSLQSTTVVKDEIWAFQNSKPSFSPDGEYVLFTAYRNFEQDIFVYHLARKQTINLTNTGVSEASPVWSPDGKSIYFASNRTKPSYPMGMRDASIYRMALDNFDEPYRMDKFDALFEEKKEDKKDSTKTADKKPLGPIVINTQGLLDRITLISPAFGTQTGTSIFKKGEKTYIFYYSNHEGGRGALFRTIIQPFEENKTEKVIDGGAGNLVEADGKFFALSRGTIQKYNIDGNKLEKVDIAFKFQRNLEKEFMQMFYETWAGIEENFYDGNFHGVDWTGIKKRYATYLPYLNSRADLRILLNDMLGELNSSHLGFSSGGPEERKNLTYSTNETGIIFDKDDPYRVHHIVANSHASRTDVDIQPGDVLVAVDGQRVDNETDRDYYFTRPSLANEMVLTLSRGGQEITTKVRPQSSAALRDQLYNEWIKDNRRKVDSLSGNRIAYSYMKNMSGEELERFLLDMVEQENNREAIILDLRYNTGGNVHDEVLRFLSQRPYLQWQYRGGQRSPQSNFAPSGKPIVLLINEQSLSDAEMTAAGFKALKLGTIIGTETYRWIIFTSAKGLVDGSMYRVPAWGCYTLDGDDLELTGVSPDIHVENTFMDRQEGHDPQLERAVQEVKEAIKKP
ncbi:S41 family peptidase [Parapedobacter koreensis]|uniref:Tricorn protease homolog n=1 Tax=Parapedobacter koreensis TaxID=332977 RepID=A0A1H7RQG2_9SPHI|nr:S41 family peptidase [Parapedobacter koreensis]SEL62466.1 C-terminal processing protease CtpA/Prc, contains a PDZ domain [Parapedobacter koreensis]